MRNEKRRMSERVYSEHLRWTKDGLRIHEDIYNGRDDSTDWATEAEAHRSAVRAREAAGGLPRAEGGRLDDPRREPHTGRAARHGGPAAGPRVSWRNERSRGTRPVPGRGGRLARA
jgi:hypothetical protein